MAELVTIPISFFEVRIDYENPDIRVLGDRTPFVHALTQAWAPFKPSLDDLEVLNSGKISEQGLIFRLPTKQVSFFVGPTLCRFSRGAVSWELAEETIEILDLAVSTLSTTAGVVMGAMRTTMGLHLQPRTLSFVEILRPFVAGKLYALDSNAMRTAAAVVRWENRAVTLDGSASLANAVFMKLERTFPPRTSYEDAARQLFKDEEEMFSIMDVQEERP